METLKQYIEEVLKENEKARNDDFVLCINVYVKMGFARKLPLGILINYKNIESAPAFESISRIRRDIQNNEHRFVPNEETRDKRKHLQEASIRHYTSNKLSYATMKNSWMSP